METVSACGEESEHEEEVEEEVVGVEREGEWELSAGEIEERVEGVRDCGDIV